jgi:hypothetical protein
MAEDNIDEVDKNAPIDGGPPVTNADRAKAAEDALAAADAKAKADAVNDETKPKGEEPAGEETETDEAKGAREAEEAKAEADKAKTDELDTQVWGDMGNEEANAVLQVLQNSGVSTDDAKALLWDAVEAGDPKLVDRDALIEKVGKANAVLIMSGIENYTTKNTTKLAEVRAVVDTVAGSRENWDKAAEWARANVSESELNDLREMIDHGGSKAKFASQEIVRLYNDDPKNTALSAGSTQVIGDTTTTTPAVKGITRLEYGQMLQKHHRTGGTDAEFKQLQARRAAGKKQGI